MIYESVYGGVAFFFAILGMFCGMMGIVFGVSMIINSTYNNYDGKSILPLWPAKFQPFWLGMVCFVSVGFGVSYSLEKDDLQKHKYIYAGEDQIVVKLVSERIPYGKTNAATIGVMDDKTKEVYTIKVPAFCKSTLVAGDALRMTVERWVLLSDGKEESTTFLPTFDKSVCGIQKESDQKHTTKAPVVFLR